MADFLTGNVATWSQSNPVHHDNAQWFYANFATDTWKATQKLTVNYGLAGSRSFRSSRPMARRIVWRPDAWRKGIKSSKFVNAPAGLFFPR